MTANTKGRSSQRPSERHKGEGQDQQHACAAQLDSLASIRLARIFGIKCQIYIAISPHFFVQKLGGIHAVLSPRYRPPFTRNTAEPWLDVAMAMCSFATSAISLQV